MQFKQDRTFDFWKLVIFSIFGLYSLIRNKHDSVNSNEINRRGHRK